MRLVTGCLLGMMCSIRVVLREVLQGVVLQRDGAPGSSALGGGAPGDGAPGSSALRGGAPGGGVEVEGRSATGF